MAKCIDKSALVAEIEKLKGKIYNDSSHYYNGWQQALRMLEIELNTIEVKEVDLDLIIGWFEHIAQIADDRKTANGKVMEDWAALDEIKAISKDSVYYIKHHCL